MTTSRREATKFAVAAIALAICGVGCSLLVPGDVADSDFQCDPTKPSSASTCPSGMTCSASTARCEVPADAALADTSTDTHPTADGPVDATADAPKDAPDSSGPLDLGAKCRVDNDCKSHLCATSTILTTTIAPPATGPICTTPCCTSTECPLSFVCFNGGTGGGYCVPATVAQRTPPPSGGKAGGYACSVSTDCRSGLCTGTPMKCLDTCCVETDCGGSSTCRVATVSAPPPAHDIWVCALPESGATGLPGDSCSVGGNASCLSDTCIGTSPPTCRPSCASTASCQGAFPGGHCTYGTSGTDQLKVCIPTTILSRLPAGEACGTNGECQSDFCDPELMKCANVCARDIDCAAGQACRPSAINTPFLRCVPKP